MDYQEFLQSKKKYYCDNGFEVNIDQLNSNLKDFQKWAVHLALKRGNCALFEGCGLGKTIQQLSWAYEVVKKTNQPVLILAPLAVSSQTIREGVKFGIEVRKLGDDAEYPKKSIYITNYEQLDNIDCSEFGGVVLDESSILKSFTGKIKNQIIDKFQHTRFKLACTATPSPNDFMELGNHSQFLGVMPSNEMLARWFINDTLNMGTYRLKKNAEADFWEWVSSWAVCLSSPKDIGFDDTGYNLPPLNIIKKEIKTDKVDNGKLFNDVSINATNFNQELRRSLNQRLQLVADIVNNSDKNFIVWIKQNAEGDLLKKLIPDAVEVRGNDKPDIKEKNLLGFANNEFRVLITKAKIAQFGLNYQNCNNQIFASLDFSFESTYQAIRRSYRFGQQNEVNIYLLITDTMGDVLDAIKRKESQFEHMQKQMSIAISKFINSESSRKVLTNFRADKITLPNFLTTKN